MGASASITMDGDHGVGAARSNGSCAMPARRSFATDRTAGRFVAYPDKDGGAAQLDDTRRVTCPAGAGDPLLLLRAMVMLQFPTRLEGEQIM